MPDLVERYLELGLRLGKYADELVDRQVRGDGARLRELLTARVLPSELPA
jgi:hypothetical protein